MANSNTTPKRPGVGVSVFILRPRPSSPSQQEFIVGKRKGSHGAGTWALPGGHIEFNETLEDCSAREILEETGLTITNVRFLTCTNDIMVKDGKHYVTVFMVAEVEGDQEPEVLEPQKCERWEWVDWEEIVRRVESGTGEELFMPLVNIVKQRPGVVPSLY